MNTPKSCTAVHTQSMFFFLIVIAICDSKSVILFLKHFILHYTARNIRMRYTVNIGHLDAFSIEVNLDQCVSHKMSEAAAVKVAVRVSVAFGVIYLREFQTSILVKVLPMKVFMGAEDLQMNNQSMSAMNSPIAFYNLQLKDSVNQNLK